jgi:hypothetical protein
MLPISSTSIFPSLGIYKFDLSGMRFQTSFGGGNLNVHDFHHQIRFEIWNETVYSCGRHEPALDFDDVQNRGVKKGKKPKKEGPKRHQKRSTMVLLAQGKPKYAVYS